MLPTLRRCLHFVLPLALALAPLAARAEQAVSIPSELMGAWKSSDGLELIRFQSDRMLQSVDGHLKVRGFVRFEPGRLILRAGMLEPWSFAVRDGVATLEHEGKRKSYTRLAATPQELELDPLVLGVPGVLTPERVGRVRKELGERAKKDQSVRMDPAQASKMSGVDADNLSYIRSLVMELGWIDADRFGPRASADAFLLVQHSEDLRLMMAVLPWIEKDARRFPDFAQPYTLLYDRMHLDLGDKQRYGTQLNTDAMGNPFVLPLEDPRRVDEFLKELKLPPLSEYLATASKYLYDNKPIRMPRADE